MIHNAQEMKKAGLKIPLLIGGATTGKDHTAIKIAPHYDQAVVQVPDASLVVNVCNDLTHLIKKKFLLKNYWKKEKIVSNTNKKEKENFIITESDRRSRY